MRFEDALAAMRDGKRTRMTELDDTHEAFECYIQSGALWLYEIGTDTDYRNFDIPSSFILNETWKICEDWAIAPGEHDRQAKYAGKTHAQIAEENGY